MMAMRKTKQKAWTRRKKAGITSSQAKWNEFWLSNLSNWQTKHSIYIGLVGGTSTLMVSNLVVSDLARQPLARSLTTK